MLLTKSPKSASTTDGDQAFLRKCTFKSKKKEAKKTVRDGGEPKTFCRTLCFVLEGSADVRNPFEPDFKVFELAVGDHFGASDLLQIPDIDYMGDIIAGPRGLKVLVVENPDQVI